MASLHGPSLAIALAMTSAFIGWRTFMAALKAIPPAAAAAWVDCFSYDEKGALLIDNDKASKLYAVLSALVPSKTIH